MILDWVRFRTFKHGLISVLYADQLRLALLWGARALSLQDHVRCFDCSDQLDHFSNLIPKACSCQYLGVLTPAAVKLKSRVEARPVCTNFTFTCKHVGQTEKTNEKGSLHFKLGQPFLSVGQYSQAGSFLSHSYPGSFTQSRSQLQFAH